MLSEKASHALAAPVLQNALKVAGALYLLYLAYRTATASFGGEANARKPLSFLEAVGFQYLNPKAWVMGSTATGAFSIPQLHFVVSAALITRVVTVVNLPCISVWAAFGTVIGHFLMGRRARFSFNLVVAALLVGTVAL